MSQPRSRRRGRGSDRSPRARFTESDVLRRAASVPQLTYPDLPVSAVRDDIGAAIRDHQVVIVAGETGSGKTTQLPKICLELGLGVRGFIGHTQPRRIAARSVSERIAEELGVELGGVVGYQVRFTDRASNDTLVKLMTDGILLAELQRDRLLSAYDVLVIDEAHERSLNIDFILGYLKQLLPRRPDLKVVITSATIDPEKFSRHFDDAPIIEVSGRTYPVEVRYRPLVEPLDDDGDLLVRDQTEAIVDAVTELTREGPGDILVFLPGEREIRDTADVLGKLVPARPADAFDVVPLYARLSSAEQHKVFQSHTKRRVVLATNVAETSLTVPGIRYVVDSGVARISRYSHRTKVQRLPIEPISQASANQRSGRCGRVEAGIAIRLYAEEDFEARPQFTDPEILRTNLASVILQMTALGLGDVARFPFVDPPDRRNVAAGVQLLEELGALEVVVSTRPRSSAGSTSAEEPRSSAGGEPSVEVRAERASKPAAPAPAKHQLTPLGRRLAQLPVDPRLGRMVLEADRRGCLREVLVIAAALSIPDPRERPADQQAQADQKHARFRDESSDFLTLLNLWRYIRTQQRELSSSAFRRMCRTDHLNYLRIREWQELEQQLRQICKGLKMVSTRPRSSAGSTSDRASVEVRAERASKPAPGSTRDRASVEVRAERASKPAPGSTGDEGEGGDAPWDGDAIHQSLLAGLLSHVGLRDPDRRDYLGARGARFAIFPGSGLFKKQPALVMAAELVETARLYARVNAAIKPEWAEAVGAHLVRRTYSEPHWSKRRGAVMAYERVTLYGVPLVADRLTAYSDVDPALCRELFIRHALVYGEWSTRHRFFHDNRALLEEAEELEHRARRRDIVVDEHTLFDFYDARVGAEVVSGVHFDTWWKRTRQKEPDLLTFDPAMLVHPTAEDISAADFPDLWHEGPLSLPISYHFEPGATDDGVTVDLPVATLNQVPADAFSWQVPGLREELVVALLRSLPKALRVNFVPAPNHARDFLAAVAPGEEGLLEALERHLRGATGVVVPREAWDWSKVPAHLRPTFRVVAADGSVVGSGKDLTALKQPLAGSFAKAMEEAASDVTVTGETTWTFGTIEQTFTRSRAGHEVVGYPGLVDEGSTVGLAVFGSAAERDAAHRLGVRRLVALAVPSPAKRIADGFTNVDKLTLAGSPYPTVAALLDDCVLAAVDALVDRPVQDAETFDAVVAHVRQGIEARTREVLAEVVRVLEAWRSTDRALTGSVDLYALPAVTDMRGQVSRLVTCGFVADAGADRLRHLSRYLTAVRLRREALGESLAKDRALMDRIAPLEAAYLHRLEALPPGRVPTAGLVRVRWLLEEYRVSLWAQHLGTADTVSDTRIRKALDAA